MSSQKPKPVHGGTTFEDLSGISTSEYSNPYDALIAVCEDDLVCYGLLAIIMILNIARHKFSQNTRLTARLEILNRKRNCSIPTLLASVLIKYYSG